MKHLCLVLFWVVTLAASGQNVWFVDDFRDNRNNWYINDAPEASYTLANDVYGMEVKNSNVYWVWKGVYLDPKKDFTYEVIARKKSGDETADFGIAILGKNDAVYQLRVNPGKQQTWLGVYKKEWKSIVANETKPYAVEDYKFSDKIKKDTALNKLTVQRRGDEIICLINGAEVFRTSYSKNFEVFTGNFGFVVSGKMKMEAERMVVLQDNVTNLLPNMPTNLVKENLGSLVNTTYDEVIPRIAPDGKTIYYSIKQHPDNTGGKADYDDAWYSEVDEKGNWGNRKKLPAPPNAPGSTYVVSALPDNNTLVMNCKYNPDMTVKPEWGLSIVQRTETGWVLRENIDIPEFNSQSSILEMCMSADQKAMLVTLKKKDSYGERDIYVSVKGEDGKWSVPFNIGNVVNSMQDESSPFIAADGVSLYFASNGHPGYGSTDIFVSRRLDDTWKNWSTPLNLGLGINTDGWEGYYNIPASGAFAYLTSNNKSLGGLDIVKVSLPEAARPKPVVIIYGKVLNSKTKQPLQADITYRDLGSNKELGVATSSAVDGSYKIVLPAGVAYSFLAQKQTFYAVSENIDLKKLNKYQEIKRDLYLSPIEVGQTVRLNNLFFDTNKFDLRDESKAELDRLITILSENPDMNIQIEGHTDNVGQDAANLVLSSNRAKAVVNYLIGKGIAANRLKSKGFGKTKPIAANTTDEGRQRNRRVEFAILKK
jgi:outer membrane protein OmpA-like peptidoglycan-associated protein